MIKIAPCCQCKDVITKTVFEKIYVREKESESLHNNKKNNMSQKYLVIYGTNPLKTQQHEGYLQPELVKCILIQITLLFRQQNHMAMKRAYDMINGSENLHMHPLHSK